MKFLHSLQISFLELPSLSLCPGFIVLVPSSFPESFSPIQRYAFSFLKAFLCLPITGDEISSILTRCQTTQAGFYQSVDPPESPQENQNREELKSVIMQSSLQVKIGIHS